jgi:signal transduction histidine kinase
MTTTWTTMTARQWATDAAIAVLATGADLAFALSGHQGHGQPSQRPGTFAIVLLVVGGVALLARRSYPRAVLAVVLAATLGATALGAANAWIALLVAFFTAVLGGHRVTAIASLVVGYVVSVFGATLEFDLLLAAGLVTLLSVAELARARSARVAADRRGRAEASARLASDERLAIARDLHDVVAHSISVINVQANTALHLMDRQPERAHEALTAIRDVSGQALGELATVLGALRAGDQAAGEQAAGDHAAGGAPLAPVPGVARLDELAARARSAGFAVSVTAHGPARPLPAGVDAAAYRIVQEALTNAVRHSAGHSATVQLRYGPADLEIEVADDGTSATPSPAKGDIIAAASNHANRTGNGLRGMAERARALGGSLDAGPRPGGGFRVLARLPA